MKRQSRDRKGKGKARTKKARAKKARTKKARAKKARLNKSDKAVIRVVAAAREEQVTKVRSYRRGVVKELRSLCEELGYSRSTFNKIRKGSYGFQANWIREKPLGESLGEWRVTTNKAYQYKHIDRKGRVVPGRWMTKGAMVRIEKLRRYWDSVNTMSRVLGVPVTTCRRYYKLANDKRVGKEVRSRMKKLLYDFLLLRQSPNHDDDDEGEE